MNATVKRKDAEGHLLMLGIDNAGKTSILKRMLGEDITVISPTQGFSTQDLTYKSCKLKICDISGHNSVRRYWKNYFPSRLAIIFVLDSSDRSRLEEAGQALQQVLAEESIAGIPLAILANKQDLLHSIPPTEICVGLNLHSIQQRPWAIFPCSSRSGQGIEETLDFVTRELANIRRLH